MILNSENINELASALAKAQAVMKPALKDKKNPHFKNLYASLNSVIEASKDALSVNGLSVSQQITEINDKTFLVATLMHSSGQYIRSYLAIKSDISTPQKLGSCLTYYRRYSLSALIGIDADECDDDGNEASKPQTKVAQPMTQIQKISDAHLVDITEWVGDDEEWREKILGAYRVKTLSELPDGAHAIIKKRHEERTKCE
jgi:hypothetical protein